MTTKYLFSLALLLSCSHPERQSLTTNDLSIFESAEQENASTQVVYLLQSGKFEEAIDKISFLKNEDPLFFHFDVIQKLTSSIISSSIESRNDEEVMLGLFAISITQDEELISLIEPVILSQNPYIQLAAVRVLSTFPSDRSGELLGQALCSDFFFIRLEAAYELAKRRHPNAYKQLEALYWKLEPEFRPLLAQAFSNEGSTSSIEMLKRQLVDESIDVRLAAITACGSIRRDDIVAILEKQALDPDVRIQEAAAFQLAVSAYGTSIDVLVKLSESPNDFVALTAAYGRYMLGDKAASQIIEEMAVNDNIFAIKLLGIIDSGTTLLTTQSKNSSNIIRINAIASLLEQKQSIGATSLVNFLDQVNKDLLVETILSPGKQLSAFSITPSMYASKLIDQYRVEMGVHNLQQLIEKSSNLPESQFLMVAEHILGSNNRALIPVTIQLVENINSDNAVHLLKRAREEVGAPFIRSLSNLALFNLTKEPKYRACLIELTEKIDINRVLKMRPPTPWNPQVEKSPFTLTLEEESELIVATFMALAEAHDESAVQTLLTALKSGNKSNRPLIAALLLRASL